MMPIRYLFNSDYNAMERAMFFNHMPPAVRKALANMKVITNNELAAEADAVMEEFELSRELHGPPHTEAAIEAAPPVPKRLTQLSAQGQPPGGPSLQRNSLCFIHKKFGMYGTHTCARSLPLAR